MADERILRGGSLDIEVVTTRNRKLHVRLARAEPHLTHKHILNLDLVPLLPRNDDRPRLSTRSERIQPEGPFAIGARRGGLRLAGEGNSHRLTCIRPSPHRDRLLALKHHVIRERRRQFQLGGVQRSGLRLNPHPGGFRFFNLGLAQTECLQNTDRHQLVARHVHVHPIAGQHFFVGLVLRLEALLEHRVQIGQRQLPFLRKLAEEFVVRREPCVLQASGILIDDGRRQDHRLHAGSGRAANDGGDVLVESSACCHVFLVGAILRHLIVQRHAGSTVPHVIDAATQRHPTGLFAKHVLLKPGQHLIGLVASDAGGHSLRLYPVGLQPRDDKVHVAHRGVPAKLGDGISQEGNLVAALHCNFRQGGLVRSQT